MNEKSKAFELIEFVWNNAISEAKAYAAIAIAEEGMRQKAIEAFKFAVDGYFIIGGTDYSADRLNEFIKKLES